MANFPLPEIREDFLEAVESLKKDSAVQAALKICQDEAAFRTEEQIELTEIPSPPFKEKVRAEHFAGLLKKYGAEDVYIDEEGNVRGLVKGKKQGPTLVIASHLDSVFPEGTPIKVRREGAKLFAPGISDDTTGLSCLLQILRAINKSSLSLEGNILFVGTVGEEGNGDLRGSKFLWKDGPVYQGMLAIDSAAVTRLLYGSTGSKRYRVVFEGPGGHSLREFGKIASATQALCRAGTKISDLQVPSDPVTTFTVGVISGGTSVNAIAARAEMEVDMRSDSNEELDKLVNKVLAACQEAVDEENARWQVTGDQAVVVKPVQIGYRPAGCNKPESPVLHAARAAQQALGIPLLKYATASTDQNIPLSLGVPATTLGGGGTEGHNHSLLEWYDTTDAHLGPQMALLAALALVGVEGVSEARLG